MKYAVIDIGSNSVRLMVSDGKATLYKKLSVTRLGAGRDNEGNLSLESQEKSLSAISDFVKEAQRERVDKVFAFATAAVRNAPNGREFVLKVRKACGFDVDVLSGEKEAELGILGALDGNDGGIIDVGGASTEIGVVKNGKIIYLHSLPIGAVALTEAFGQNAEEIKKYVKETVKLYGSVPKAEFYAIGGSATTVAAVDLKLKDYDPNIIDGHKLKRENLLKITELLNRKTPQERENICGVEKRRADIIHSGAIILSEIVDYLDISQITVSESDNAEGYLTYAVENL